MIDEGIPEVDLLLFFSLRWCREEKNLTVTKSVKSQYFELEAFFVKGIRVF